MLLIPGTAHIVRWVKQNLLDETTYYPLAIIRDTRTNTTLDSFALNDLGSGRFSQSWNVAQDPTGQGREIEIEITIYEDAAHTQVSGAYGRWTETYLILALQQRNVGGPVGVDYKYLRDMIEKIVKDLAVDLKESRQKVDLRTLENRVSRVHESVEGLNGTISERMESVVSAGEKAGDLEDVLRSILAALEALQEFRDALPQVLEVAAEKAGAQLDQQLKEAIEAGKIDLSKRSDEELSGIVGRFKEIMDTHAASLGGGLEKMLGDALGKLKLTRTTESFNLHDREPKVEEDGRGKKFLNYVR